MEGYLTVGQVQRRFNISRETVRRWEGLQGFPKRVRLSTHPRGRCGFPIDEIDAWDAGRRNSRQPDPPPTPRS
jgi:predicted DNA-binding transcriptional regulator AlpA